MEADMKVNRLGRICLVAVLAISVFAVSSASAAEYEPKSLPEAGRCVKVGVGKGVYKGPNCIYVAPEGKGVYEWEQVLPTDKFTWSGSGVEPTLATIGHGAIKCLTAAFTGEYITPKKSSVTVQMQGCVNTKEEACQSTGTKSELMTVPLEAELGFIRNEVVEGKLHFSVGLDLKSPSGTLITYECGGKITEPMRLEGSVIAKRSIINKMTLVNNLAYVATKSGLQVPTKFQGEPQDTLFTTFTVGFEETTAPSTLAIKEYSGTNSVPIEVKAREVFP
jgi:hypothetical protein